MQCRQTVADGGTWQVVSQGKGFHNDIHEIRSIWNTDCGTRSRSLRQCCNATIARSAAAILGLLLLNDKLGRTHSGSEPRRSKVYSHRSFVVAIIIPHNQIKLVARIFFGCVRGILHTGSIIIIVVCSVTIIGYQIQGVSVLCW